MAELVECPSCEGTGTVRLPNSETPSTGGTSGIEGNITEFTERIGVPIEKKRNQEFITCPNCNGCGYVRG
jgi:RecJ-like exonuclease